MGLSHSRIFEVHGRLKWLVDSLVITTLFHWGYLNLVEYFWRVSLGGLLVEPDTCSNDGNLDSTYSAS